MTRSAISVENLSKAYRIGLKEQIPDSAMGAMTAWLKNPAKGLSNLRRLNTFNVKEADQEQDDILWALRDVSFEVKEGEVVGIIGRNGAGKSTLLKILSRITEPTSGRIVIRGRVSSLLEVGTGFHPDLTGRENVYLNGTILGMTKREIDRKFDEIVDFSGVEKFLDTPTKRYSSGMQVRLAFAVAAHLEPEILIIDEVLAVGDMEFQKKCLGKMQDVANQGRTVLFVSHNMLAVKQLCSLAVILSAGRTYFTGDVTKSVGHYMDLSATLDPIALGDRTGVFRSLFISDSNGNSLRSVSAGDPLTIGVEFDLDQMTYPAEIFLGIDDIFGTRLLTLYSPADLARSREDDTTFVCHIPVFPLAPGDYFVTVIVGRIGIEVEKTERAGKLTIISSSAMTEGRSSHRGGLCVARTIWTKGKKKV